MTLNIPVTTRLNIIKNLLAGFLIITVSLTWPLWSANRTYPLFPGADVFLRLQPAIAYTIPLFFIITLLMALVLRRPRLFIALGLLAGIGLLALDTGRMHYWFYFYLLLLAVLMGYNWRVDNPHHYTACFNALKVLVALVYLLAAIQHFQPDFAGRSWPAFIKPFERFWTPEQCAYLLKLAYVIPVIELFILAGFFFQGTKLTAITFAVLLHIFSVVVVMLQPVSEPAVLVWHVFMIALIFALFGGATQISKRHGIAFTLYPAFVILFFGILAPVYFFTHEKPLENKIDLMQANGQQQYLYISEENKSRLPLYVQSFALQRENGYYKLCVTGWSLHELKTRQLLSSAYLMKLTGELAVQFGIQSTVSVPAQEKKTQAIALK